jgi:hypothetical protein
VEASAAFAAPPIELLPVGERPQGSEDHTVWCPTCMERVLERGDGCCVWCDTPLGGDSSLTVVEAPVVGLRNSTTTPEPEPVRLPRRRDRGHRRGKPYTDEQVIARIQLWAKLTGSRTRSRPSHIGRPVGAQAGQRAKRTSAPRAAGQDRRLGSWRSGATSTTRRPRASRVARRSSWRCTTSRSQRSARRTGSPESRSCLGAAVPSTH